MANGGLRELIFQVISSWQVIAATVVIVIYIFLVNYVSGNRYRKRSSSVPKQKKIKTKKTKAVEAAVDDSDLGMEKE